MKKTYKALCAILAVVFTLCSFAVSSKGGTKTDSYIWIFEAEQYASTTLKSGRASGVGVIYSLKMRYVSLSGDKLSGGEIPTRFVGSATIDAQYDYCKNSKIAALASKTAAEYDKSDGLYSYSYSVSNEDFPGFEESEDESGTYFAETFFYPGETVFADSENVITALGGENHSGMTPGRTVESKRSTETANLYFNAESDDMEIGSGTPYGVRNVKIFVTVYGSNSDSDAFSFEANGLLKRVPATAENIYGVMASAGAEKFPDIDAPIDSLDVLDSDTAILRMKSYLADGEYYWPENLPSSIPEFDEAKKYTGISVDSEKTVITASCTEKQLSAYEDRLIANGNKKNGNGYFTSSAYISISKSGKKDKLEAELKIYIASKVERPYEYGLFPEFDYGCIITDPHGENTPKTDDSAWLTANVCGATEKDVNKYGEKLIKMGFDYDNGTYTYESDGYRYSFSAVPFVDERYKGMSITYYIVKIS